MLIAGLAPCSFVDYPGRPAGVIFLHGCNLRCGYCHNPDLVSGPPHARFQEAELLAFLERRRGRLGGVVVTGGEPTVHRGLAGMLRRIRALGFPIKLDTNGTHPDRLRALLDEDLIDYVAMDLKEDPERPCGLIGRLVAAESIQASLATLRASGVDHEVRTTVISPFHDRDHLLRLAAHVQGTRRWWLQRYRPGTTLSPDFPGLPPETAWLDGICADLRALGLTVAWR